MKYCFRVALVAAALLAGTLGWAVARRSVADMPGTAYARYMPLVQRDHTSYELVMPTLPANPNDP